MVKIMVTGAAGAIGYHLSVYLATQGYEVVVVDNFCRGVRDKAYEALVSRSNVFEINLDLCRQALYDQLPKDVDYIYHLAALNGTQNFYDRPFEVLKNSTLPTLYLLNYYAKKNIKRFVYASSSEAYASSVTVFNWPVPTTEEVPLTIANPSNVRWSYGGSKLHGELALVAASKQYGMPFTIIRYHNVYGPRMGDKHVIPDFLARAREGVFELYGYKDTRSFIYVSDAIQASILIAQSDKTVNQIINVGGLPEITMLDLGKKMLALMAKSGKIICYPSPVGSVSRRLPDLKKLRNLTDYKQTVNLEDGLKRTIDYYMDTK